MLPEKDALELIAGLERASQRTRPYLIIGLLAIVAGFVILSYYLNEQRREAEGLRRIAELRADEQGRKVEDLSATLDNARKVAGEAHPPERADEQWRRLRGLLKVADREVNALGSSVRAEAADAKAGAPAATGTAASPTPTPSAAAASIAAAPAAPPPAIRLFVHISDESQRPAAEALARSWAGRDIQGITVVVPGVQRARSDPENTIRCLKPDACALLGPVTDWVNKQLAAPQLTPRNLVRLYGKTPGVRPGTFEIWFDSGAIEPAR
ncbi:MAG: hypothetical protein MT490_09075 [Sphingomonas sp.]|uniref:hypothetical protein n=1 Tax=Sphingomonas sp. TaxID=28214 RepID=UPI002272B616|nr:hypothetical protein [Sphingomonas sp.]MCX8475932.1 hypothetical protein [Sphingomonas sp.]